MVQMARLALPVLSVTLGLGLALSATGCRWMQTGTQESDEQKVSQLLADLYTLPAGRTLDIRPPPHPPERLVLYRASSPSQARAIPSGPTAMVIVWRDDGPVIDRVCFGCDDLVSLVAHLGVRRDAIHLEGGTANMQVIADIVKRDGATRDELLSELSGLLSEKLDLEVSFQQIETVSRTLVLRGEIGTVAPDDEYGGLRYVHAFVDTKNEDPRRGAGGGPSTGATTLVELLSVALEMPVIDETIGAAVEPFHVRVHDSAYGTEWLELLIRNLEAQTDLDITLEERPDLLVEVSPVS